MKATELLSHEEIRELTRASDVRGWLSVATTWGLIAASLALVARWPNAVTVFVALFVIGGRQLGLAILMHECAHHSLFRTRALNDIVGHTLIAAPVWQDLTRYRKHHLAHHRLANTEQDPDLGLVTAYPTTRASFVRKVLRDLSGIAGIRRVFAQLTMDAGMLSYTASTGAQRQRVSPVEAARNLARRTGPVVLANLVLLGILWALGHPWLYAVWAGAYLTTFSLFMRLRSIAEHAMMPLSDDVGKNTRTTRAGVLARLSVAPHHVNYHLEHHLLMTVPHWQLPRMHTMLRERGAFDAHNYADGYGAVLRRAAAG